MAVLCWLCMAACCCSLVRHLQLIVSGIKDVLDTLITGSSRKRERFPAGGFQTVNRIFVGQFQKPHTTVVGLLFYTLGGKDRIYYLTGTGADPLRPFAETVTVPFQILWLSAFFWCFSSNPRCSLMFHQFILKSFSLSWCLLKSSHYPGVHQVSPELFSVPWCPLSQSPAFPKASPVFFKAS